MKRLFSLFLILLLALAACGPQPDGRLSKEDVFALVNENQDLLLEAAAGGDFAEAKTIGGIQDVSPYETYIDFSCGGAGLGSETAYAGFYYIPEDDLAVIFPSGLTPQDNGFLWQDTAQDSDNTGYLEKICGCFYYYELDF